MSNCCDIEKKDICDTLDTIPFQYRNSKNLLAFMSAFLDAANHIKDIYIDACSSEATPCGGILRSIQEDTTTYKNLFSLGAGNISFPAGATDLFGAGNSPIREVLRDLDNDFDFNRYTDILTRYGEKIGFPRKQCNVLCGDTGEYSIDDNELYCKFLSVFLLSKQGPTTKNLQLALNILYGPDAFIISSGGGKTKVSSGRPLTDEEASLVELYRRFLPHVPATKIEIYEIGSLSDIVGFNCGDCSNYQGFCDGASALCLPVECPLTAADKDDGVKIIT